MPRHSDDRQHYDHLDARQPKERTWLTLARSARQWRSRRLPIRWPTSGRPAPLAVPARPAPGSGCGRGSRRTPQDACDTDGGDAAGQREHGQGQAADRAGRAGVGASSASAPPPTASASGCTASNPRRTDAIPVRTARSGRSIRCSDLSSTGVSTVAWTWRRCSRSAGVTGDAGGRGPASWSCLGPGGRAAPQEQRHQRRRQ